MPRPPLLTIQDIADEFRVPVATVRRWRFKGTGPPSFKVGRHVRYRREAVDAWVAGLYATERRPPS